jgi:hypothetical protein
MTHDTSIIARADCYQRVCRYEHSTHFGVRFLRIVVIHFVWNVVFPVAASRTRLMRAAVLTAITAEHSTHLGIRFLRIGTDCIA